MHIGLVRIANLIVSAMKGKLGSGYPSGNPVYGWIPIQDTIFIGDVKQDNIGTSITIELGGEKAPYAAAYEWGSGLHATKSAPRLYPIVAKNAPNLVFFWQERGKWFVGPRLPIGHPGVAPKPYIKPSIDENKVEMKKILAREFKIAVLAGTKPLEEYTVSV